MNSEIIQNVSSDNYDDFQHDNFIFSQIFVSLFQGLFNEETDLRVRYWRWQSQVIMKSFLSVYCLLSLPLGLDTCRSQGSQGLKA
jgi:hypothetical protein